MTYKLNCFWLRKNVKVPLSVNKLLGRSKLNTHIMYRENKTYEIKYSPL